MELGVDGHHKPRNSSTPVAGGQLSPLNMFKTCWRTLLQMRTPRAWIPMPCSFLTFKQTGLNSKDDGHTELTVVSTVCFDVPCCPKWQFSSQLTCQTLATWRLSWWPRRNQWSPQSLEKNSLSLATRISSTPFLLVNQEMQLYFVSWKVGVEWDKMLIPQNWGQKDIFLHPLRAQTMINLEKTLGWNFLPSSGQGAGPPPPPKHIPHSWIHIQPLNEFFAFGGC